ncbi:MAG: VWA-like domain-containing protein [Gammaproteobacteria bacterium]
MSGDIETKLSAARTCLILDKPFLGALVLRLPLVKASATWCPTTATDARSVFYNAGYIDGLSADQTQFVLAHEALHCALSHFVRREHRSKKRWDVACDLAINPILVNDGLTPPPNALYQDGFEGMSAEEIYPFVEENTDAETMDQHLYDSDRSDGRRDAGSGAGRHKWQPDDLDAGASRPQPLTDGERKQLEVQWRQRLAGAAQQAMAAGKLAGGMARLVDHLLQPRLPWRMLLARYMTTVGRDDYNYARPSRREGSAILPSLRSAQVNIVVALDISGSVTDEEVAQFLSEVNAIKGQVRARITMHACDADLAPDGPWTFEPWEEFVLPRRFSGGGGTRFTPVFTWLETEQLCPDLLVYFTDAEGEFPKLEPNFPVIWLIKGRAKVPWGQRIQLN